MTEQEKPGNVAIVADTTCALPEDLVQELGILLVPYYVNVGSKTLRDVVDIGREEFYSWLPSADKLPTTSNPGPGDYLVAFKEAYQRTRQVLVLTMTSIGSGAYQAACVARDMAAEELPGIEITVLDTRQVAMAHGWAVLLAARAAQAGAAFARVIAIAKETAEKATMIQTADTLRYLYLGGRIGRAQHLVGALLNIKPLISMQEGVIVALGQARSRAGAYDKMVELIGKHVPKGGKIRVAYMHAAAADQVAEIRRRVESLFDCVETLITELSPALGVHTGPGMTGLAFLRDE